MSTLKPRTATVLIYQGDDLEQLGHLRRAAELARRQVKAAEGRPSRVGDAAVSSEAEEAAYDAFVEEAAERAVMVELRAIGSKRFRELVADHPPRTGDDGKPLPEDAEWGVDTSAFPYALLCYADGDARTVAAPELKSAALREFVEDELSDGDLETLWTTAYLLNRGAGSDPKASLYSTASLR